MKTVTRATLVSLAFVLALPLAACSQDSKGSVDTPTPEVAEEPAGASTIEEVFDKLGCEIGDILGTDARVEEPGDFAHEPAETMTGTCKPGEGGELTFFWQYETPGDARTAATNGSIEVGATEQMFIDGAVLILARDAATSSALSEVAQPVN